MSLNRIAAFVSRAFRCLLGAVERPRHLMFAAASLGVVIACCPFGFAQAVEAREGYVDVPGAHLWYRDTGGTGAAVIFLHAGFGHAEFFERYQLSPFSAAGYRVIAYDRRGYGRSRNDEAAPQPKVPPASEDLLAVAKQLGIDRFHLVATAGGGIIALDFALNYPQRLRSLVIANSIGGLRDAESAEMARRLRPPEFDALPIWFKELGPEYRAADPQGVQQWIEIQGRTRPEGPAAPTQPLHGPITFAALAKIEVPAFLLTGDADLYSPPTTTRQFARRMRNAQFASLAAVGHSAYWEQPEVFNSLVLNFIDKH